MKDVRIMVLDYSGLSQLCGGVAEASGMPVAAARQFRLLKWGERTRVRLEG